MEIEKISANFDPIKEFEKEEKSSQEKLAGFCCK